jgi:hypothetical protein
LSDRTAWVIAGLVVVAIGADYLLNDGAALLFLMRKGAAFVEYLAFWR